MKTKTIFVCQNCGFQTPRWIGRCSGCGSWNSVVEEEAMSSLDVKRTAVYKDDPMLLKDIQTTDQRRYTTDIRELDRVLGGGVVPGSVVLIGGDPGIGKSTLSLQTACSLSQKGYKVLYISGEESIQQTKMRAERLAPLENQSLYIVNQVDLNVILEYVNKIQPDVMVVDSIQVIYLPDISSSPGSVSQVRECASLLTHTAKSKGMSLFIIGHVTKEGMLAGPRVLEHIVDTVLYFEGERYLNYRVLRATKNRFGATNEIGVFEMTSNGLKEVFNPSEIFIAERPKDTSGSVVVPIMEGTRPVLVEIQGLVSRSSFGVLRQKTQGFDPNRLALLSAVLEKRVGLNLFDKDIFLNVVGGIKVEDPAADLGVALAIISNSLDKPLGFDTVVLGEIGLSAEIRSVSQVGIRINEAERLGFKRCLLPQRNLSSDRELKAKKIELVGLENIQQVLKFLS